MNIVCAKLIFSPLGLITPRWQLAFLLMSIKHITVTAFIGPLQLPAVDRLEFQQCFIQCKESKMKYSGQGNRENIQSSSIVVYKNYIYISEF